MDGQRVSRLLLILIAVTASLLVPGHVAGSGIQQIRGAPVAKNSLYRPDRDFECLDGSRLIPFTWVNDDYCDCGDGSDEPGTAACAHGSFYCENAGHKPAYIPSSWVNDGVCDCCDTSDEYASGANCANNCNELGREARLEQQKAELLAREGNKLRLELSMRGKSIKAEHHSRLAKLRADHEEAELIKKEKEVLRTFTEERESLALEKYKPAEAAQVPSQAEDRDDEREEDEREPMVNMDIMAKSFFGTLDSDNNGVLTIAELLAAKSFDRDKNGMVTEEEALHFLDGSGEVTLHEFRELYRKIIRPYLEHERGLADEAQQSLDESLDHEREEDDGDMNENDEEEIGEEEHEKEPQEPEIQYDEETQALVDEATSARERYQEAEKAVNELQSVIRQLEEKVERDYGPDEEFASLDGECFEYADLEYVYKLCLYGKASQNSKSGGSDVTLGHWYDWVGPSGAKYTKMKYDRGLTCWNGPARSTIVNLSCGTDNKLTSVTEPSRCEYAMEFTTPTLCNPNLLETADTHDEL